MIGSKKKLTAFLFCISCFFVLPKIEATNEDYIIYTIQKCGTHLLEKVFNLFTEYNIPHHKYSSLCHFPSLHHTQYMKRQKDLRKLVIIRDLRDASISAIYYFSGNHRRRKLLYTPSGTFFDRQLLEIATDNYINRMFCTGIQTLDYLQTQPEEICIIRFEDLVGPKGGGSREKQIETLWRIAEFAYAQITEQQINRVADNLFGSTATFRKGQIGDWKNYFKDYHIEAFKETYGDFLIRYGYEENYDW